MATAAATFTLTSIGTALKAYLGISGSGEDASLTLWIAAAAKDLDVFAGWYYTDVDGDVVDETPTDPSADPMLTLGIYEWVRSMRNWSLSGAAHGLSSVRTGALQETYRGDIDGAGAGWARKAADQFWSHVVYAPLRMRKS